jgi:hypothetical protein
MQRRTVIRLVQRGNQVGLIEVCFRARAFATGKYVNTQDGLTAYIYDDNGKSEESRPYRVAICEHDEERSLSANELTLWTPKPGQRVTEIDNEDSPVGIVVEAGEDISQVVWKNLRRQVPWVNSSLEPIW